MPESMVYGVETNDANLHTWSSYIGFLLWLVFENNVQNIDLLSCNLWNDSNWRYILERIQTTIGINIRASIDITKSVGNFILESDNVDTIGLYFTKQIVQYKYLFASIGTEYLALPTITPEKLYRNVATTITYTAVDEIQRAFTNGIYKLYVNTDNNFFGTLVTSFTPTGNTYAYTFGNVTMPSIGRKTFTIQNETDPSNNEIIAMFDMGVLYEYDTDISFVHVPLSTIVVIPESPNQYKLSVDGLTNGQDYLVFLKSTNAAGDSAYYSASGVHPFTVPVTPEIVTTVPLVSSILVNFQQSVFDGGNTITSYAYSLDNSTYVPLSTIDVSNQSFVIPNLTNGNAYIVYLTANNARGNSAPTVNGPIIPFDIPDPPVFNSVDPSFGSIIVRFTQPFDGGNTMTYEYSILTNDGYSEPVNSSYTMLTNTEVVNGSFTVNNLTNENLYKIYFRTVNARGSSLPTISEYIRPDFTVPNIPTIGNVIPLESSIQVDFNDPAFTGGNSISSYAYSIDSGNTYTSITSTEFANRAFTANHLTNGTFYVFYIVAINARGYSLPLITFPLKPFVIPDLPSITSAISLSQRINVTFSPPAFDGGNTITKYTYSIDNTNYIPLTLLDVSNQAFTIPNLTNGNSYVVYLKAFNARGNSSPAISESVIPFTIPDSPVVNNSIPLVSAIQVDFSPPLNNGGNAISEYAYAIQNNTLNYITGYTRISITDISYQSFIVNNLANGNSYTLYFVAINTRGNSVPTIISNIIPFSTPLPPNIQSVVSFDSAIQVFFNPPSFNGGNTISVYNYSIDRGYTYKPITQTYVDVLNSSFTIPNLINGNSYVVYLEAVNARGNSSPAISESVIPFTIPDSPVVNHLIPLVSSIQVDFSSPVNNGGNAVSGYAYAINDNNVYYPLTYTDISYQSFIISGLTNGNSYSLYFVAINTRGNSIPFFQDNIVPYTVPLPPSFRSIVTADSAFQISFNVPSFNGGNTITKYAYYTNRGNTYTYISSTDISNQSFIAGNLTNGQSYVVYLEAFNARGNSSPAISSPFIPFTIPNAPQINRIIPTTNSIEIIFTEPTSDGGNAISYYTYSVNGNSYIRLTQEDIRYKQFAINGLTPGSQYTIYMNAWNARGNSLTTMSDSVFTLTNIYRNTPVTLTYVVNNGKEVATIGNTYYLYNGNTYLSAFTPTNRSNVYVFANTYISTIGYNALTIRDSTLTDIVSFERFVEIDSSGGVLSFTNATDFSNNRFRIAGLKNGVSYLVCIKSKNIFGNSIHYSFTSTIPFTVPDLPRIITIEPLSGSAKIGFTDPSFNGGNAITGYSYSTNGGNTYTPIHPTDISNHSFYTGPLLNGNTYTVYLKAFNARGNSVPVVSNPFRPFREPDAPSSVLATGLNGFVQVDFSPPLFDGGNAITSYLYSYDYGTTYNPIDATSRSFYIPNLSNGRPYNIYLKAVNSRGESVPYISSPVVPNKSVNTIYRNVSGTIRHIVGNLSLLATNGTRYSLYTEGNTVALSSFTPNANTMEYVFGNVTVSQVGYTTFYIKYTPGVLANTNVSPITVTSFTEFIQYNNPYTELSFQPSPSSSVNTNTIDVTGLIDGQTYIIFVKSTNARGDSVYYSFISAIPYREPDAPTDVTVTPLNQSIQVDFLPPSFDGGNTITSYTYSWDYETNVYTIDATARSFFIPNLSNGRPYTIYVRAVNARGTSLPYISSTVIPNQYKNSIYQNVSTTVRYIVANKRIPTAGGTPNITYELYLKGSNIPLSRFRSVADPQEYVFGNIVIPQIGYVTFDIKDITTPHPDTLYPVPLYSFTEFVKYSNDATLVFRTATSLPTDLNSIVISGLIDGQKYVVFVKSTNSRGDSVYYSFISEVPYREPDPPIFTTIIPLVGSMRVEFSAPFFNGGNTITSYAYSVDGGNTYASLGQTDIQNGYFTVSSLTNGLPYVVYLKAQNSRGYSLAQTSSPIVPFTIPDAPLFRSVRPSLDSILVDYSDPVFNGGNTITSYAYSMNGGNTYVPVNADDFRYKQFAIDGLSSGTTYTILLKAYNARGNSAPVISYPIVTLAKIYRNIPTRVTYMVNAENQPIQNAIIGNTYNLYAENTLLSTFTPTTGTNPFTYVFNSVAVSTIGNHIFSIRDVTTPESPRIIATFSRFVYTEFESSSPLSFVQATDFSDNKFRISGLRNGTSYTVFVKALNINGNSVNYSFTKTIPFTIPDSPQFDSIVPLVGGIQVGFSDPDFNGGNTITSYDYSVKFSTGNTFLFPYTKLTDNEFNNRSFIIQNLTNGNLYSIYLRAYNARGNSSPATSSNVIAFSVPSPPIITRVTPLDRSIQVLFSEAFNGGNTITSYEYSYNFGATYSVASVTNGNSFIVPNLINEIPYHIYVRAKNARGYSAPTVSTEVTPRTDILITDSSYQTIYQNVKTTIHYLVNDQTTTDKMAKLGNTYALCIGNTQLSTFTPQTENTFEYVFGNVVVPTFGSTGFTVKNMSNNGIAVLSFTKFVEYQYQPELEFVSLTTSSIKFNTIRIPGLTDGQQYIIFIKSSNVQGDSQYYSFISQKPFREPDSPTIQMVTPRDQYAEVSFTKPAFDGGNAIQAYEYSYDFGETFYTANVTNGNTFIVPDLINEVSYYIYLRAQNARGYSVPYMSQVVTPTQFVLTTDSSFQDIYQNVKTTIHYLVNEQQTNAKMAKSGNTYALYIGSTQLSTFAPTNGNTFEYVFGNVVVSTFGSTDFTIKDMSNNATTVLSFTKFVLYQYQSDLSFVSFPVPLFDSNTIRVQDLLDGQQYIIFIKSINAQGDSQYYSFVNEKPFRLPDSPTIQMVTPRDRYAEVSFMPPAFDGGNTITAYEYSYDFGTNYSVAPVTNGNTFIVPNLLNDQPYYIYLRAKNARGYSLPYMSRAVTPTQSVFTTDSSSPDIYQNVTTTIRYMDNAQLTTDKIAKRGNTYALCIGPTQLSTFTPQNDNTFEYVFGNVVVPTFGNTVFTIKDVDNNGTTVLSFTKFVIYQYQSDLSFGLVDVPNNNRIIVSGLTDGQQYIVFVRSTNSNGDSMYYSFTSEKPFREPDLPTIRSVTPKDESVEISFTKPAFDGGNAIMAYEYSYDFGSDYSVATVTNGNSFIVSGLINDLPYYIYLKAKNARGYSNPYISTAVTPKKALNVADPIYQNRKTTVRYIVNNNVSSYLDKKAKSGNTYALYIGGNSLSTFTPTNDTFEYVFGNVTVPIFGNTSFSINDTTGQYPVNVLSFNQIVLYEYESELSFTDVSLPLDRANTIRVPQLVNGQQYVIFMKSVNIQGQSEYYSFTSAKPYRLPDPPVIEYLTPNDASIDVFFTPPFDGGIPITSYSYAYTTSDAVRYVNDGSALTYTAFETRSDGLYRIPNLTNGVIYTVYVKSNNLRGNSVASSSASIAPFSVPFSPTIYRLKPSDSTIQVYFTEPANGGNTITDYLYSINSTNTLDYVSMNRQPATNNMYLITGLINYTQYTIRVKAVNARGNSLDSLPAIVKTSLVPYQPTIYRLIPQIRAIDIVYSAPNDGGNPIIDYTYSVNGSEFVSMNRTATDDIFRISDLSNGIPYDISIQANNIAGNSVTSNIVTTIPFDIPDSPSIVSIATYSKSCVVVYSPPPWNGGNTITGYKYSLNFGPLVNADIMENDPTRFTINTTPTYKLTNGTKYSLKLFAVNARGNSFASVIQTFTPQTVPDVPTGLTIDEPFTFDDEPFTIDDEPLTFDDEPLTFDDEPLTFDDEPFSVIPQTRTKLLRSFSGAGALYSPISMTVQFETTYDGGNKILYYNYDLDEVPSRTNYAASLFTIDGLIPGKTYTLMVYAYNAAGFSSAVKSFTPCINPSKPSVTTITPYDSGVMVEFAGLNGGSDLTAVKYYSTNNNTRFIQLGLNPPNTSFYITKFPIGGTPLNNGTTYSFRIQTINRIGASPFSEPFSITPYTNPKLPTIRYIKPGIGKLIVFFTPNTDNGGNTVTQYEYVYKAGNDQTYGNVDTSTISLSDPSFTILNLTYAVNYSVRVRAINAAGSSGFSNEVAGSPVDVPVAPTLNDIVPSDKKLTVYFTKNDPRGEDAEMCKYNVYNSSGDLLDSREFQTDPTHRDISFDLIDITGSPLINGLKYYIDIQNQNLYGYSTLSKPQYSIPRSPPLPPIFLTFVGVNGRATITFEQNPDNGGADLTDILVSFNGPLRSINKQSIGLDKTTLQFGGLNNKTNYVLQLYAVNPAGISRPSELTVVTYEDPASRKYLQKNSTLNPNGSSSNKIRYSTIVGISRGNTRFV
jgi:hypothetical protein